MGFLFGQKLSYGIRDVPGGESEQVGDSEAFLRAEPIPQAFRNPVAKAD